MGWLGHGKEKPVEPGISIWPLSTMGSGLLLSLSITFSISYKTDLDLFDLCGWFDRDHKIHL